MSQAFQRQAQSGVATGGVAPSYKQAEAGLAAAAELVSRLVVLVQAGEPEPEPERVILGVRPYTAAAPLISRW